MHQRRIRGRGSDGRDESTRVHQQMIDEHFVELPEWRHFVRAETGAIQGRLFAALNSRPAQGNPELCCPNTEKSSSPTAFPAWQYRKSSPGYLGLPLVELPKACCSLGGDPDSVEGYRPVPPPMPRKPPTPTMSVVDSCLRGRSPAIAFAPERNCCGLTIASPMHDGAGDEAGGEPHEALAVRRAREPDTAARKAEKDPAEAGPSWFQGCLVGCAYLACPPGAPPPVLGLFCGA